MTFPTWPTVTSRSDRSGRRDERGAVLPSPVVLLSILAVALAAVAFVVTRDVEPTEREITTVSDRADTSADDASDSSDDATDAAEEKKPEKPKKPKPIQRDQVGVVVFNNTSTTGLAGEVGNRVSAMGWNFVAADNWYGTVVATTVYYPEGLKRAAQQLALDLGIQRVQPADVASDMSTTNLTLILTGALD